MFQRCGERTLDFVEFLGNSLEPLADARPMFVQLPLPKTNSSHLRMGQGPQKERIIFQPPFLRGDLLVLESGKSWGKSNLMLEMLLVMVFVFVEKKQKKMLHGLVEFHDNCKSMFDNLCLRCLKSWDFFWVNC